MSGLRYAWAVSGLMTNDIQGHAFISYVREDKARVDRLQRILEAAGIRVWRDTADLWPGQDWKIEIRRAINTNSLAFIACFSEHSQRRAVSYQNEELLLAVEQIRQRQPGDAWLIPVRFADCNIPNFDLGGGRTLESLQRVDLFSGSWDRGTARLIAAVLRTLGVPHGDGGQGPENTWDPWYLKGAGSVSVVCTELPSHLRGPLAERNHPHYDEFFSYADLGSLIELYGHLRALNPATRVDLFASDKLTPAHYAAHLISLGGVSGNYATRAILDRLVLPVKQVADWASPDKPFFEVDEGGDRLRFQPVFERSDNEFVLKEDVALFVHAVNPFNNAHSASVCAGMHAGGTRGVVRALTDPAFRDRNAKYLSNRFEGSRAYFILARVGIQSGVALTPDWTSGASVLYEWADDPS